jgi:hypothetical protein
LGKFFQKVMADTTIPIDFTKKFEKPQGELTIELDCYDVSTAAKDGPSVFGDEFEGER